MLGNLIAMPREIARRSVAQIGYRAGLYARRVLADARPIVLTYHGVIEVGETSGLDRFCVTARRFRHQLEQLGRVADFVGVHELLSGKARCRPPILLSFDDGFRSVYHVARPVLRQLGIPAVVSVPAGLVDTDRTIWSLEIDLLLLAGEADAIELPVDGARRRFTLRTPEEREQARQYARHAAWQAGGDAPLRLVADLIDQFGAGQFARLLRTHHNLQLMNSAELRDLTRDGFDIAVHGYYHLGLATLDAEQLEREVREARSALAARLPGTPVDVFCLPYGSSSPAALAFVRDAGFRACLTTEGGRVADPWLLSRFDAAKPTAMLLRDVARAQ